MGAEDAHEMVSGLVASHGAQLQRFLLARVANVADVHDIAQEVYLRMLRIPNIESIRSPEAYLFTVAQHVVQQHTLKALARPPSVELTQLLVSPPAAIAFAGLHLCRRLEFIDPADENGAGVRGVPA